jgi:hypothetical protein
MTSTSDAPDNWRFDRLATERAQAVAAFGLTERQAPLRRRGHDP